MKPIFPSVGITEKRGLKYFPFRTRPLLHDAASNQAATGYPRVAWPTDSHLKSIYLQAKPQCVTWQSFRTELANLFWAKSLKESPKMPIDLSLLVSPTSKTLKEDFLDAYLENYVRRLFLSRILQEATPSRQKEILHRFVAAKNPKAPSDLAELTLKTQIAWETITANPIHFELLGGSNPKPEDCIPLASHLTELFWRVSLRTAEYGKVLGNPWFVMAHQNGYQVPKLAHCAIQLAMAEVFSPLKEGTFLDLTYSIIVSSENNKEGISTYSPYDGEINIHNAIILQAAGTSENPNKQAKAYLANYVFHEVCHGFQSAKERPNPPEPPNIRKGFIKNLEAPEIVSNAMGIAAERLYSNQLPSEFPQLFPLTDAHEYLISAKHISTCPTFPIEFQKHCKFSYRAFRLLHLYYLKKLTERLSLKKKYENNTSIHRAQGFRKIHDSASSQNQ